MMTVSPDAEGAALRPSSAPLPKLPLFFAVRFSEARCREILTLLNSGKYDEKIDREKYYNLCESLTEHILEFGVNNLADETLFEFLSNETCVSRIARMHDRS